MFSIFSDDDWLFSALLTAAEDACNEEGGGSAEGRWRDGKKYFHFVRGLQPWWGGEEGFNNFKKRPVSNIRGGN